MDNYWKRLPVITRNLIIINFACWLLDIVLTNRFHVPLSNLLGLHYFLSPDFHFWQPFTYMFMHAGFDHIFFNMFAVLMFAAPLEQRWGSKRFIIYYLISGLGAAIVQELVWFIFYGQAATMAVTIGASGAVFGVLFAFGWLFPDVKMFIMFIPIPIRARVFVIIYALVELFLGVRGLAGDNVAHFAHLGGMLFGWLTILFWKYWDNRKRKDNTGQENNWGNYHYQDPI